MFLATSRRWHLATVAVVSVLVMSACSPGEPPASDLLRAEDGGVLLGLHPDLADAPLTSHVERLSVRPAVVGLFERFPFEDGPSDDLEDGIGQARAAGAAVLLTLEPHDGLERIDPSALEELTSVLTRWNDAGTAVVVRFAHEMNGSWYPWGQQPDAFVRAFRAVAAAVRSAPASEIMWAPNDGVGYPFDAPATGEVDERELAALDTTGDGRLTGRDDPYSPYWPGAEHVDWVGLSVYHVGVEPPWGDNEAPAAGALRDRIHGRDAGPDGANPDLPDFHETYVLGEDRPFAIAETGALFSLERADEGADNAEITGAWAAQLFAPDLPSELPGLQLIVWFEHVKPEPTLPGLTIAWGAGHDPGVAAAFRAQLPTWARGAEDLVVTDRR